MLVFSEKFTYVLNGWSLFLLQNRTNKNRTFTGAWRWPNDIVANAQLIKMVAEKTPEYKRNYIFLEQS